jgi:predicted glycosyltransferase
MRVAIDLTNSPHVPFFAPIVRALRGEGHEVFITARRFAQTVELAEMHDFDATVIGAHGGATTVGKATSALSRTWKLWRHLRRLHRQRPFDIALSHGSTDLPLVCSRLDIPHVTAFDYEWATTMHRTNCRRSWRVVTPDAIPPERLWPYGAAGKLVQYPGLKEQYYLDRDALDPAAVRDELGVPANAVLVVLRPPPELALYHRGHHNEVFGGVIARIRETPNVWMVVLPRTPEQRVALSEALADDAESVIPEHAVDGASLVAAADLVVSAGGTMNREAAALGVPVYTVFAGQLGGVDEALLEAGQLRRLRDAADVDLVRRSDTTRAAALDQLRDPADLLAIMTPGLPMVTEFQG